MQFKPFFSFYLKIFAEKLGLSLMLSAYLSGALIEIVFEPELVKSMLFQKYYVTQWDWRGRSHRRYYVWSLGGGSKRGLKQVT